MQGTGCFRKSISEASVMVVYRRRFVRQEQRQGTEVGFSSSDSCH